MGTALHECHSIDQSREMVFCEPFFSSEPREPANGYYLFAGSVFARWRPSSNYVFYTYVLVFSSIGVEDAESRSDAVFDGDELYEFLVLNR